MKGLAECPASWSGRQRPAQAKTAGPHPEGRRRTWRGLAERNPIDAGEQAELGRVVAERVIDRGRVVLRQVAVLGDAELAEVARSLPAADLDTLEEELLALDLLRYCRAALQRRREQFRRDKREGP